MKTTFCLLLLIGTIASCSSPTPKKVSQAHARIQAPENKALKAEVHFMETENGLKVLTRARGLKPHSVHDYHTHEVMVSPRGKLKTS